MCVTAANIACTCGDSITEKGKCSECFRPSVLRPKSGDSLAISSSSIVMQHCQQHIALARHRRGILFT